MICDWYVGPCLVPQIINGDFDDGCAPDTNVSVNTECTMTCDNGYEVEDFGNSSYVSTCLTDGHLSVTNDCIGEFFWLFENYSFNYYKIFFILHNRMHDLKEGMKNYWDN